MVFMHMDSFMDIEGMRLFEMLASLELEDICPSLEDTNSQLPFPGASDSSPTAAQNQIAQPIHPYLGNNGFTSQPLQSRSCVGPNHHVAPSSGPPQHKPAKKSHKSYSVEDEKNLVQEVAIHGQKWKSVAKRFPERSEEKLKQKWKDVMEKAGTKMDENKKRLHIFAAVVHVNTKKESKYKQKFQKWFEEMEKEDQEIKAYAENWLREVRKIG
ncbi:unnamed protein product [Camellia sinensis]